MVKKAGRLFCSFGLWNDIAGAANVPSSNSVYYSYLRAFTGFVRDALYE